MNKADVKTYRGLKYAVFYNELDEGRSGIAFYCGYVRLPYKHPYRKFCLKTKRVSYTGYNSMNIQAHGGLTFSRRIENHKYVLPKGNWIGWDYGHAGDEIHVPNLEEVNPEIYAITQKYEINEKRWTVEEVEEHCKNVIDQVLKIKK